MQSAVANANNAQSVTLYMPPNVAKMCTYSDASTASLRVLLAILPLRQLLQASDRHVSMQSFQHQKSTLPHSHDSVFEHKAGM